MTPDAYPPLTRDERDTLLALALRDRSVWDACQAHLTTEALRASCGAAIAFLWQVVEPIVRTSGALPPPAVLQSHLQAAIEQAGNVVTAADVATINELLQFAFDEPAWQEWRDQPDVCRRWARHLIRRLKLELLAREAQSQLALTTQANPAQLPDLLQQLAQKARSVQAAVTPALEVIFPDRWLDRPAREVTPTLIPALDNFFGGGMAPGELYTFLGPYGSCKTTIAVQLTIRFAKHAAFLEATGQLPPGQRRVAVFVSTELSAADMRIPFLACAAMIPRQRLRAIRSREELCRSTQPAATAATKYEEELFADQLASGVGFRNEYQRADEAIALLNRHLWFIDLSGQDPDLAELGLRGIADIDLLLRRQQEQQPNTSPLFLALDHASALALRMVRGQQGRYEHLRHYLRQIVADARQHLARPFGMPVLLLHQLAAAANRANPLAELSSADAAECKSFIEYTDFAVVSGVPTRTVPRLARLRCDKFRHQPPQPDAIIRVDGEFSRIRDVSDEYTIDPLTRQFALRSELSEDGFLEDE